MGFGYTEKGFRLKNHENFMIRPTFKFFFGKLTKDQFTFPDIIDPLIGFRISEFSDDYPNNLFDLLVWS